MRNKFFCLAIFFALSLAHLSFAQVTESESSEVQITVPGKKGEPLTINGKITDAEGKPVFEASIWIYHTDSEGRYALDENGREKGWRHSLYSAKLKTADDGTFTVHTIKPAGYPNSINPAHIHIRIEAQDYPELEYTTYFQNGDRITDDIKEIVEKYGTMFLLPISSSEDGKQMIKWQIKLLTRSPY